MRRKMANLLSVFRLPIWHQDWRGAHLSALPGQNNGRLRVGLPSHVRSKASAEVGVADIRPHRPIQRAAALAVKDARVLVDGLRHPGEIDQLDGLLGDLGVRQPETGKRPIVKKCFIAAVPTAPSLAERTGGAGNNSRKSGRFR